MAYVLYEISFLDYFSKQLYTTSFHPESVLEAPNAMPSIKKHHFPCYLERSVVEDALYWPAPDEFQSSMHMMHCAWSLCFLLALLDYVSRAHEIKICLSSVRVAIISELNARISFKF